MKFKRVYIQYSSDEIRNMTDDDFSWWVPCDSDKTTEADEQIEKHLNEGWKIVSSVPVVGTFTQKISDEVSIPFVVTDGIEVLMIKEG